MEEDRWSAAAALVDRSRRALFDYVRRQDHPVSREEAAQAQRISRGLAAFHLDKLVEAGLLRARYQAPPDRPRGRGRAPKVYEAAASDGLSVTIPERRYRLIAEILAEAVAAGPGDAGELARQVARQRGAELGRQLRDRELRDRELRGRALPGRALPGQELPGQDAGTELVAALARLGFEPRPVAERRLRLHNCPFHALAQRQTELVCRLNLAFLTGLVEGLAAAGVRPELVPQPGACCVELAPDLA